ncbi:heme NO-binding domain-containing protein [Marinifilum fragile]|uniref:heme NO-binding domain-containing protein n=1 Tax=Marinifilum fragile TaxID=570161 RepID=UPI002AA63936|nr:heme NO-binding domain-containing protein [Marinifilum fragile]
MKGIFFTELLEMAEREYGSLAVDKIIPFLKVGDHGVFNANMDYPFSQFHELINRLANEVRIAPTDLTKLYGEYLFSRLIIIYRPHFAGNSDIFEFLEKIDYFIHVKLQADFPHQGITGFKTERINHNTFTVSYQSTHDLIDLAIGLFMGCQKFFNEDLTVNAEIKTEFDKEWVYFTLNKSKVLV